MNDVDEYVTVAMARHTDRYVKYCRNLMKRADETFIEVKVANPYVRGGFGTVDFGALVKKDLWVVDLKYGKGPVSPYTPQARYYGISLYEMLKDQYDIKRVHTVIIQPRLHGDDQKATWEVSDLMDFGQALIKADKAVEKNQKRFRQGKYHKMKFKTGSWCTFCRARLHCRANIDQLIEHGPMDTHGFSKINEIKVQTQKDLEAIEQCQAFEDPHKYYAWADYAIRMGNAIKALCLTSAASGVRLDGYKLVEGRSSREWDNWDQAQDYLRRHNCPTHQEKPTSVAQAEKMIEVPDYLYKRISGKPVLVPESDKRPELDAARNTLDGYGDISE